MANLKGSTFEKQIRDARIRLDKRGIKQQGTMRAKNFTHSNELFKIRENMLKDFAKYAQNNHFNGKINDFMTKDNINAYLTQKIENLSLKSSETVLRNWSGLIQGLQNANITIKIDAQELTSNILHAAKQQKEVNPIKTGRYISRSEFTENIAKLPAEMQSIAKLQYEYGFRSSEALKIAKNPQKYIKNDKIQGVKGKGGKIYKPKKIDSNLKNKLLKITKTPSSRLYLKKIKQAFGHRAHDLRLSFAVNKFQEFSKKMLAKEAMYKVSRELNHERAEITKYYLKQA